MKNTILLTLLFFASVGAYAQKQNSKPVKTVEHPAISMLSAEQQVQLKQIHQQFVTDMKAAIEAPVSNPMEKRQRIEKLRAARDSSLKAKLGEQVYAEYLRKAVVKKR